MPDSHNDVRMEKQSQNNWQCKVRNTSLPSFFYNESILEKSAKIYCSDCGCIVVANTYKSLQIFQHRNGVTPSVSEKKSATLETKILWSN